MNVKRFYRKIVFCLLLIGNMAGANCETVKDETRQEDCVRALGARLGEKIGFVIGVICLCYVYYSWSRDTWGLRDYGKNYLDNHRYWEANGNGNMDIGYVMDDVPEQNANNNVEMKDVATFRKRKPGYTGYEVDKSESVKPSESLLSMAGVEKIKVDDTMRDSSVIRLNVNNSDMSNTNTKNSPFKHKFRDLSDGNYISVDDKTGKREVDLSQYAGVSAFGQVEVDSGNLSGNEVFRGSVLKVDNGSAGHSRKNSLRPFRKTKHNGFMYKARKTEKDVQLSKMKSDLLRNAKDHKVRTDELNKMMKKEDPDATTVRYSLVDRIIGNGK